MSKRILPTQAATLEEATVAFAGMDAFVDALAVSTDDDGLSALSQMKAEITLRAARYPLNAVVQSTAVGLQNAYSFAIIQRLIDLRLGTKRPPTPPHQRRKPLRESLS